MEITYTQQHSYSLDLTALMKRDLADHLGISSRQLTRLVKEGMLMDEYNEEVHTWVVDNSGKATVTDHTDIEIEGIYE